MSQRTVALILQARMGSTRLPGKSMMPLAGEPLVGRILERVKRCSTLHSIILATTTKPQDDVLVDLARQYQVQVFRGSENDLVDRYLQAGLEAGVTDIGRLPADNPVPEPSEIDRIVRYHLSSDNAFSSNLAEVFGNGYPDGIGSEVITLDALKTIAQRPLTSSQREHPHTNFYDYAGGKAIDPERFPVGTVACPPAFRRPDLVLDVNTPEHYAFISALYDALYPRNPAFGILDIIDWYDNVYNA